ncbi:cyclophilin-like protein [Lentinula aff. detonsa]|uniref:Cyclophilin-like protein n=1 Tax=Lentinula aff. detonsa TaxID=2804958 RepID=A0AA38K8K4_9AGAR|nr:cyclophilin-like protein [Lentinula aff. detonsa]KAJ3793294.1 cyclophilin-like protein [Lentinula aff. detonsa]
MALPTHGRVIIVTTVGEIDIELWSKETPKTCRNFLALAMEGYYDGVIFHRVVPGFLVQTGDKTGTGMGGESFYGEPFEDEIHPRLRFAHRGLVAMANNGQKNSNDSQFFITLDRADELHGKHTLFGRCIGDTFYNVMKIGELELDAERPVYPPKIKGIRIIENPFPDIIPRITAAEKRAQQRARDESLKEREEYERRKSTKKNVKLLSFGTDEGIEEEESVMFKKKPIVRPDLIDKHIAPPVSGALPDFVTQGSRTTQNKPEKKIQEKEKGGEDQVPRTKESKEDDDLSKIREKFATEKANSITARQAEISKMEAEIRKLTKRRDGSDGDSDDERKKKKTKTSYLEAELGKYASSRGLKRKNVKGKGKVKDESDVLNALNAFRGKLQMALPDEPEDDVDAQVGDGVENSVVGVNLPVAEGQQLLPPTNPVPSVEEDPGIEIDDDRGFLSHSLRFPKDDGEESRKAERDYEVIDPRQRGARAKEEERARKAKVKFRDGGRGSRGSGGVGASHR